MDVWYFTCSRQLAKCLKEDDTTLLSATGWLNVYLTEESAKVSAGVKDEFLVSALIPNSLISNKELSNTIDCEFSIRLSDWRPSMLCSMVELNAPESTEDSLPLNSEPELFSYLDKAPVNANNLIKYEKLILLTYSGYVKKRDTIQRGFLSGENVEWLIEHLLLNETTDEELNEIWFAIDLFFRRMMFTVDKDGELQWRTDEYAKDIMWWMDCDSAWKEVVNCIARRRRGR